MSSPACSRSLMLMSSYSHVLGTCPSGIDGPHCYDLAAAVSALLVREHVDLVGTNLRYVAAFAVLLVGAVEHRSFDVDSFPLLQVLTADVAELCPRDDAVKVGYLLSLTVRGEVALRRYRKCRDRRALRCHADLRVGGNLSDEDDLVDASHKS